MEEETRQAKLNRKFPIVVALLIGMVTSFIGGFFVVVVNHWIFPNEAQITVVEQPSTTESPTPEIVEDPVIMPETTESQVSTALVDRLSLEDIAGWGMALITGIEITIYGFVKFKWGFNRSQSNIVFFILTGLWILVVGYVTLIIRAAGGIHAH